MHSRSEQLFERQHEGRRTSGFTMIRPFANFLLPLAMTLSGCCVEPLSEQVSDSSEYRVWGVIADGAEDASEGSVIKVFDADANEVLSSATITVPDRTLAASARDDGIVAALLEAQGVLLLDVRTNTIVANRVIAGAVGLAFAPESGRLAVATSDLIVVVDDRLEELSRIPLGPNIQGSQATTISWSPDETGMAISVVLPERVYRSHVIRISGELLSSRSLYQLNYVTESDFVAMSGFGSTVAPRRFSGASLNEGCRLEAGAILTSRPTLGLFAARSVAPITGFGDVVLVRNSDNTIVQNAGNIRGSVIILPRELR